MSTNYLALRNSNLSTFSAVNFTYSSLTGSTITARTATYSTITLASSIVSLGQSTNQTYYGQTNGVYTTGWGSTLNTLTSNVKQVAMGSLGQYQVAVCGASTANSVYVTQNSGQTWSTLSAATGLPLAASTLYTSGAVSATGQYGILATTGGYPYVTSSFGATYANVNPNVPAIYLPLDTVPANSSVSQGTSPATLTVVGPPTSVPGVVGANAIRLANTVGSSAGQYIRGTWTPGSSSITVSLWFNAQIINGTTQNIFVSHNSAFAIYINSSNNLVFYQNAINLVTTSFAIVVNTWYNVTIIYQPSSIGYLYVNNVLIGTGTCGSTPGTSTGYFSIGSADITPFGAAFNGYIDDLKIYNTAIAFNPMVPMNYNFTAVSGNGQYMLASVSNGGLFMSSNFGSTWSQVQSVANQGVWTGLCLSYTGQYMLTNGGGGYVVPNMTGLTGNTTSSTPVATTWTSNGVTWTSNASSVAGGTFQTWIPFNTIANISIAPYAWASAGTYPSATYNNANSMSIQGGIGTVYGEWLQLQCSVPLIMYNYALGYGGSNHPKSYYIVGSNDGSTWYPIQLCSMSGNPNGSSGNLTGNYILINSNGTQTITTSAGSGSGTFTSYSYSSNAYTYFRLIIMTIFAGGNAEIEEWFINFIGGQSYSTNYGNSWVNTTFATGNALAISENGQYAIGANVQTAYIVSNYLAGFSTQSFTSPTLTSINATIVAAAISNTGQYMVLVTAGTSNNLYYSTNYGSTFTGLSLGSAPLVSCSMSYDGSYITAASATTVYTLNSNGTGFSLAVGSSAGAANQAQNAIALGNSAGQTNQTANSIILNASGSALNSYSQGFYVAPIATALSCTSQSVALLGYGTDNQVVQSGITMTNSQQVIYGEWIQLQLATGASITSYVLQPRSSLSAYYPVAWTIVGSLDGVNWTVLDTRSGQTGFALYTLQSASPIYTYFRMIITQINSGSIVDIGGFILYNNGNPILTAPNATTALAPYTLSGTNNNILSLSGSTVCTVTWSWGQTKNANGIVNDGYSYVSSDLLCAFPFDSTVTDALGKVSGPTITGTPVYNTSIQKVGGGCLDCTVNTGGAPTLQLAYNLSLNSSTGFTISFWMNATHTGGQLFMCQSSAGAASFGFEFGTNYNNSTTYGIYYGVSSVSAMSTPTNILNYGTWYLISLVLGGNASILYVNGVSTLTGTTWGGPISYSYFSIAGGHNNMWSYKGYLDDFRIYNRNITAADALALYNNSYYNPGLIPVINAYNNTTFNTIAGYTYLGFQAVSTGISSEYNSSYIATQGTSTIITNPLLQVADLSGNIKFQSSAQYPLDVNGVLRTQQLQFQDGSIQGTASNMQLNWGQFGNVWSITSTPSAGWYMGALSYSGQYQIAVAQTQQYVYISSNYGQTWTSTGLTGAGFSWCAVSNSGQYMGAVYQTNGTKGAFYLSSNYGQTWTLVTVGNIYFEAIAISGTGQYMTITPAFNVTGSIYTSSNYGQTWTASSIQIYAGMSACMSYSGQYQLITGYSTVYVSTNYGQTWNITATFTASTYSLYVTSISASGQYMAYCFATGLYVSSNYGQSWTQISSANVMTIAISASGQYQIYAVGSNAYVSTNYGQSFGSAITLPTSCNYISLSGSGVYAICAGSSSIYTSVVPSYMLGNVGIGTAAPQYPFQLTFGGTGYVSTTVPTTTVASFLSNIGYNATTRADIEVGSSNTGCGNQGMVYKYTLGMATTSGGNGPTAGGAFQIQSCAINGGSYTGADTRTVRFCISDNGSVGIGTTNPTSTLDVNGTITTRGSISFNNGAATMNTGSSSNISIPYINFNTDVLIGWSNYSNTNYNDVSSTSNNAIQGISLRGAANACAIMVSTTYIPLSCCKIGTNLTSMISFTYASAIGNVATSIGSISHNTTSVAYNTTSDRRLKENIQDVTNARSMIDKLRPRTFNFINDEEKELNVGFIAQEVQENYPQYISGKETDKTYLQIDYGKMSPFAIAACKELYTLIDMQTAKIASQSSEIISLQEKLAQVLSRLDAVEKQ